MTSLTVQVKIFLLLSQLINNHHYFCCAHDDANWFILFQSFVFVDHYKLRTFFYVIFILNLKRSLYHYLWHDDHLNRSRNRSWHFVDIESTSGYFDSFQVGNSVESFVRNRSNIALSKSDFQEGWCSFKTFWEKSIDLCVEKLDAANISSISEISSFYCDNFSCVELQIPNSREEGKYLIRKSHECWSIEFYCSHIVSIKNSSVITYRFCDYRWSFFLIAIDIDEIAKESIAITFNLTCERFFCLYRRYKNSENE